MTDPRFYRAAGPFTLGELAKLAGAEIANGGDPAAIFSDVAPLSTATAEHVSFLDNKTYLKAFAESRAGACLVNPAFADSAPAGMALLVMDDPYKGYALVASAFYPDDKGAGNIADGALVDPTAVLGEGVTVEPGAVIGPNTEIGSGTRICANAVIGAGVKLGADCFIGPLVSMRFCIAGDRVRIYAGARLGEDGFGYASDASGHTKIPQLGRVVIGNRVEIGANTTIDRGAGPDTVIGDGCIIDNLVQIGHNVQMGQGCILVSQCGVSGSSTLGNGVIMAGQSGVAGHLKIGDGARIGAQAGVMTDVPAGEAVLGAPAQNHRDFWRQVTALKRLTSKKGK